MSDRPILMSAPMVRAILAGTKTQTRRVVKPQPQTVTDNAIAAWDGDSAVLLHKLAQAGRRCPYGQPGDRLWVRETWYCDDYRVQRGPYLKPDDMYLDTARDDGTLVYAADGLRPYEAEQPVWRPSIHMPRWASRITLEVTAVRVERLQEISEADAIAEGIPSSEVSPPDMARFAYRQLWESINGPGSWDANPWVWCVEFKRVTP